MRGCLSIQQVAAFDASHAATPVCCFNIAGDSHTADLRPVQVLYQYSLQVQSSVICHLPTQTQARLLEKKPSMDKQAASARYTASTAHYLASPQLAPDPHSRHSHIQYEDSPEEGLQNTQTKRLCTARGQALLEVSWSCAGQAPRECERLS